MFFICEPDQNKIEDIVLGWERAMGVRQASGEGTIPLAGSQGTGERIDAAGGTDDAVERHGPEADQATTGLVAEATRGLKKHTAKDWYYLEYSGTYYRVYA